MPKRQATDVAKPSKRPRILDSRKILRENKDSALTDGVLNGPKFIQARENEIKLLDKALTQAKGSGKQRAFQSLPRIMRRRTASHNVKRIPKRLRQKAKQEMIDDNTPTHTSADRKKGIKRGYQRALAMAEERKLQIVAKNGVPPLSADIIGVNCLASPPSGRPKFQKRQRHKVWLPTHVWQVKRAHMETKWGYSLAVTPHEKSYRATHRASTCRKETFAWDSSYFGSLLLFSPSEEVICEIITRLTQSPGTDMSAHCAKFTTGKRAWEGNMYDENKSLLGPGLVYYRPRSENHTEWNVMIRVHPVIFPQIHAMVSSAQQNSNGKLTYHDARYAIGSIDVVGSKALACLFGAIKPVESSIEQQWKTLTNLSNVSSLSSGLVLSLNSNDPRLSFPPGASVIKNRQTEANLQQLLTTWPPELWSSPSDIFSAEAREKSYEKQATIKAINERKGANTPGHDIAPNTELDPTIPLLITKRHHSDMLTLIAPWGWILPLWLSIVHVPDVRVGGITQEHQLCFERGQRYFPVDFPETEAGKAYNKEAASFARNVYDRKPPSKRVTYDKLLIGDGPSGEHGDPFQCDWQYLSTTGDNQPSQPIKLQCIKLHYISGGHAENNARIYRIPRESLLQNVENKHGEVKSPNRDDLVGFVTTGNYNLAHGTSTGIGSILHNTDYDNDMCLVRNVGSTKGYLARWTKCT